MRHPVIKPICKTAGPWIEHHCGKHALAPLTGQDWRAFRAFAHLLELYALADEDGQEAALEAMRATLRAMQGSVRPLAKKLIPHALDWGDEDPLWRKLCVREVP